MSKLEGDDELSFCKEYITTMFKLLRSEASDEAWENVRALHELEEFADKKGKTVLLEVKLISN